MFRVMDYYWIEALLGVLAIIALAFGYWKSEIEIGRAHTEWRIARRRYRSRKNAYLNAVHEHEVFKLKN